MVEPTFVLKTDVESADHGRFIIEPLEQGYGQTLGNSLRRVMLTSLSGSAITSVKIEGVRHQFSTVPGLKEDVVELILNLKKVRLLIEGTDEAVELKLTKKGPGPVTAGDIEAPAGVTISNPELVLGTLSDKKSTLDVIMKARSGMGYMTAEELKTDEIGVIPMDALFSPVVRVNYRVEATRVGRMTNLDKLVFEIWTDGTIKPSDALSRSAKILVSYFSQIVEPRDVVAGQSGSSEHAVPEELMRTKIEELDIPTRIVNALSNGGIETIGQLVEMPRSELLKVKNLGAKSLGIVEDRIKEKGVVLSK